MSSPSFTYNNIDYTTYGLHMTTVVGAIGLPQPRVARKTLGNADGEVTDGHRFMAREIIVEYAVEGGGAWSTNVGRADSIATALSVGQASGNQTLTFSDNATKSWSARLVSSVYPEMFADGQTGSITFLAEIPWAKYAQEVVSTTS